MIKGDNKKMKWTYGLIDKVTMGNNQTYKLEVLDNLSHSHVYLIKF